MKSIITSLVVVTLTTFSLNAQVNEVNLRVGLGSLYQITEVFTDISMTNTNPEGTVANNYRGIAPISIAYTFLADEAFSYSIEAQYVSVVREIENSNSKETMGTLSASYFTIMPRLNINYIDGDVIGLSSSFGLGIGSRSQTYESGNSSNQASRMVLAFQVDLLKLRLGKQFNIFTDVGFGTRSLVSVGVGYRL